MPLAFTQEDFLVLQVNRLFGNYLRNIGLCWYDMMHPTGRTFISDRFRYLQSIFTGFYNDGLRENIWNHKQIKTSFVSIIILYY